MDYREEAKKIISENIYCTIATSSVSGEPWVSPVYFNYDDRLNIYWESYKEAKHSENIRKNNDVAIVIFDSKSEEGTGTGLYIRAKAIEVSEEGLNDAIVGYFGGRHTTVSKTKARSAEDYIGDKPLRLYKAEPIEVSVLTDGDEIDGYYVDKRIVVKI